MPTIVLQSEVVIPTLMYNCHLGISLTIFSGLFSCIKATIFIFIFLCFPYPLPIDEIIL